MSNLKKFATDLQLTVLQTGCEVIDNFKTGSPLGNLERDDKITLNSEITTLFFMAKALFPDVTVVPFLNDDGNKVTQIRIETQNTVVSVEKTDDNKFRLVKFNKQDGETAETVTKVSHALIYDPTGGKSTLASRAEDDNFTSIELPKGLAQALVDSFFLYGNSTEASNHLVGSIDKCIAVFDTAIEKVRGSTPSVLDGMKNLQRIDAQIFGVTPNFYVDAHPQRCNVQLLSKKVLGESLYLSGLDVNAQVHIDHFPDKNKFVLSVISNGESMTIVTDENGFLQYAMKTTDKIMHYRTWSERVQSYCLLLQALYTGGDTHLTGVNCSRTYNVASTSIPDWTAKIIARPSDIPNSFVLFTQNIAPDYFN